MPTPSPRFRLVPIVAALLGPGVLAAAWTHHGAPEPMAAAARALERAVPAALRATLCLPFDGAARHDWHFVPRRADGLRLDAMDDAGRRAAHDLLRSALSPAGYAQAAGVVRLEETLRDLETARGAAGAATTRDPGNYRVAIFGAPDAGTPWGWKFEGHHVALNLTVAPDGAVATTPLFLGANPAEVPTGPHAGWRLLAAPEDLGRALVAALPEATRDAARLPAAPRDIVMGPGRTDPPEPAGVTAGALDEAGRERLAGLVRTVAGTLREDLVEPALVRLMRGWPDGVRFAWAGDPARGEPFYWRLQGPVTVIEFDGALPDRNHVHFVWRDLERDFGHDLLAAHRRERHAEP